MPFKTALRLTLDKLDKDDPLLALPLDTAGAEPLDTVTVLPIATGLPLRAAELVVVGALAVVEAATAVVVVVAAATAFGP